MASSVTKRKRAVRESNISPESHFAITLKQASIAIGVFLAAGSGYAYLVYNQSSQSKDIAEIKSTQAVSTMAVVATAKEQEDKRAALGREFLATNQAIVSKLGDLTTLVAVQQERQKITDDKLGRVLDQIGTVLSAPQRR